MAHKIYIADNHDFGCVGWYSSHEEWEEAVRDYGYDPADADLWDCREATRLSGDIAVMETRYSIRYYKLYADKTYSNIVNDVFLMDPYTGSVKLQEEWETNSDLIEVVPNLPNWPGYDPEAGDWHRPKKRARGREWLPTLHMYISY